MRILFVTQIVPYPPHGGVLQRGYNLLRELGKHHEVHLLAFHHPDELPPGEPLEESVRVLKQFCASVQYFPLWPKKSSLHKLVAFAAGAFYPAPFSVLAHRSGTLHRAIVRICTELHPQIVHLDTLALIPYRRFCAGIPCVLVHHNIESQLMHRRATMESTVLGRSYARVQAKRLVRYEAEKSGEFPLNVMVSETDAALLQKMVPGVRTAVIPNGVDIEYFQPQPSQETPALIYTGGMNMFANRDAVEWFLDQIWPRIKAAVPEVRFLAVGQRPSPRVLAAVAADIRIEAPGFVPDVRTWVARAAVYIVPLRVGGGTRLKMVDAMAQGKAIVATRVGAEGIQGDDGTHFVLADAPEEFADSVIRLLRDPGTRQKLGAAARMRAEEAYAWPMLAAELAQHYENVIAEHRA
jgi:glycosyltransferase involved in cell wall biosynthesis